ncbi:RNA polymerase sigma factor [Bacillus sp. NTK071]|uniref:RNA polymerase sigma factor n=1 Tax=Bacillus sp. NTK071 TaxID=2802175 RepID=UPI001A8E805B|nr:RNA polymerase sigma factor [Bacillus sp. NTK071]MBN8210611.1 RNA polymerase sigma factor [Bacillus sp. NTK071]
MDKGNYAIAYWDNGNEEHFKIFCIENHQTLLRIARRIVNDQQIAEEIVQDVYLEVWNKRSHFHQNKGKLSSWVNQITRNRAIDRIKKEQRNFKETVVEDHHLIDKEHYIQEDCGNKDMVIGALQSLKTEQREVLKLIYIDGYSQAEVASKKKIPLGTVKSRVRLGMKKLKETIDLSLIELV